MWTYEDEFSILENLVIRKKIKDGELKFYQVYPREGYILRIPVLDVYEIDEDGEFVLDNAGNKILVREHISKGGATATPDYNWEENPCGFRAISEVENE